MSQALHLKYRPSNLDEVVGHETAVTRLRGMLKSGKLPNAILFTGPSSVGKTTLARALAMEINGVRADKQQDYKEINGTDQRSIDEIRDLIKISKFKPALKKRIIVIDEAQGVLSNAPAAAALLKPLEEPAGDTLWILCSMEPSKFGSGNGKAIANRCTQFVLEPPGNSELFKQAMRIIKGEKMSYVSRDLAKVVVKSSGQAMRTLANLLQGLRDYYEGLEDQPEELSEQDVSSVLSSSESSDDKIAVTILVSVFAGQYAALQKALLDTSDGFQMVNRLLNIIRFYLNITVLAGARHPKVWWTSTNKEFLAAMKKAELKPTLGDIAYVNEVLVEVKGKAGLFQVDATDLLSASLYRCIKTMFSK